MRKQLLLSCLFLFGLLPVAAQLYHSGEVLDYRVSYKAKLFPNTEVGEVRVETSVDHSGKDPLYRVVGYGKTLPAFRWFVPVDDKYTILVDQKTLHTRRFESDIREGHYAFRSTFRYDWPAMQVHTTWRGSRMEQDKHKTMPLTSRSMDAVSLYFLMRSIDPNILREGEPEVLEMLLEDTVRHLKYRFLGREEKKIRNMGTFHTLKFACQLGSTEGFSFTDGSEFTIWISDDRNKIPLYIESPIRVGSIQAYISGFKGLKYPLASRIK